MLKISIKDEKGSTLILTVVIVSILTLLGATFVNLVTHEYRSAARQRQWVQTYYIAEAGMAKAWFTLKNDTRGLGDNLGNLVMGPDGEPDTSDDGALSFGSSVDFGAGSFSARIADNDDGDGNNFTDSDDILMLTSTGIVGDTTRTIEVALTPLPFKPNDAVSINGDFKISGNPTIYGSHGSVLINDNLTVSGSPTISDNVTVGGNADISDPSTIGGEILTDVGTIAFAPIDPQFYRGDADYELRSDGKVFDSEGIEIPYTGEFNGWRHTGNSWSLAGNIGYDGIYYMEGNVRIQGGPGSADEPWIVTIIATGSLWILGNPYILSDHPDLLFVVGRDIKIGAASTQPYEGFILAHEQIQIDGTPIITGAIIAENAEHISNLVTENKIVGDATIGYDG
ncbi:pilus assembly PilX N-terminal domain-containing protein, partial [bacterium]|nr:pilus assembly PilX N-terminal domain-containing protein [bacterium]